MSSAILLFFVPTRRVAGATVQSCHVSFCATTAVWERSLGSTSCFLVVAHRIPFVPSRLVWYLRDHAHLLHGSRVLACRQFALLFSAISRCVKAFCIDRSGCRHQRLGVRTDYNTVSTQLPPSDTEQFARSRATARVQ